jgi:hypothetical protein
MVQLLYQAVLGLLWVERLEQQVQWVLEELVLVLVAMVLVVD